MIKAELNFLDGKGITVVVMYHLLYYQFDTVRSSLIRFQQRTRSKWQITGGFACKPFSVVFCHSAVADALVLTTNTNLILYILNYIIFSTFTRVGVS